MFQKCQEDGLKPKLKAISGYGLVQPFPETVLTISRLRKIFSSKGTFHTVLSDVNLRVKNGELACIIGRSGCGKSTLLKILAGFLPPSSGKVLLNGKPISEPGPDRCMVFQEDTLFPWLTVSENIGFGLKRTVRAKREREAEVDRFISLVGLDEFKKYLPHEISGGMKQRVALARVLILKPQVLLMDEPFASLDAQTREEMQNLLLSLWKKMSYSIVFVTHDVDEAVTLGDRILLMGKDPGIIRQSISVDLPRPRQRDTENFIFFSRKLHERLRK